MNTTRYVDICVGLLPYRGRPRGGRLVSMKALIIAATLAFGLFFPAPADCEWCVRTFCGTSNECPSNCVCAIPMGEATGYCSGTR